VIPLLIAALLAYLLGSIPFGVVVTRLGGAPDPRQIGSGNIGATNVLRSGRRGLALLTLIGDGGKGALAVLLARHVLGADAGALAGGAAFLGHLFPVFLGFKGGKGVATFFGVALAAAWPVGVAAGLIWILMALCFRWSSLAALTAAVAAPPLSVLFGEGAALLALFILMAALIVLRHQANIGRLVRGEEPKIGAKRTEAP
jgi:glycerol-3-phosphate acyltransferase PlsY